MKKIIVFILSGFIFLTGCQSKEENKKNDNKEILECDQQILNYTNDNKIDYIPIKYIIRHKVSKPKFKIKTKSGKEIIVTGDHSCIVFRNGKKISIKAKDINQNTDKILSINYER